MFFADHEKLIYSPPGFDKKYDPLRIDRILTIVSGNQLGELITLRNAAGEDRGDVTPEGRNEAAVQAAKAEVTLSDIARQAFELPPFPDCTDATALEVLYDYLGWMEGKGERARKPQSSPVSAPVLSALPPITSSLPST